ncbi:hypothetical protein [Paraglaciecola sp.]|uniref:hypothetical protein n=1 Tax=Paraglaciecola sp. TaxID=1920173 RepID=UPI003266B7B8
MNKLTFSIVLCGLSAPIYAHQSIHGNSRPDSVDVRTTVTYRSNEAAPADEVWQIPGVLMGGEALPVSKGATLDDVQLLGHLNIKEGYFVSTKIGTHGHDGSTEVSLENLWFGANTEFYNQVMLFEVGKMSTEVTPTASFHASDGAYSEAPLLADVFFGRHFVDIGVRASSSFYGFNLGVELFNGDNFPSSSGDGTAAVYVHTPVRYQNIKGQFGSWLMFSDAKSRTDLRYEDGHSHSDSQLSASDLAFTGDTLMFGIYGDIAWQLNPITLDAGFEWITSDVDGVLLDSTQSAAYLSTQDGYSLQMGVALDSHHISVKYERLVIDNRFTQTSQTFVQSTGLYNEDFEPEKFAVAWVWDVYEDFTLRTEWYQDNTQEKQTSRWSLGLVWQYKLL